LVLALEGDRECRLMPVGDVLYVLDDAAHPQARAGGDG
jgi:hypothetical protein